MKFVLLFFMFESAYCFVYYNTFLCRMHKRVINLITLLAHFEINLILIVTVAFFPRTFFRGILVFFISESSLLTYYPYLQLLYFFNYTPALIFIQCICSHFIHIFMHTTTIKRLGQSVLEDVYLYNPKLTVLVFCSLEFLFNYFYI